MLTPVKISDKFPPGTIVDYGYHVFSQVNSYNSYTLLAQTFAGRKFREGKKREILGINLITTYFKSNKLSRFPES